MKKRKRFEEIYTHTYNTYFNLILLFKAYFV